MVVELGEKVDLEKKEVQGDYELRRGEKYGCEMKLRIGFIEYHNLGGEKGIAKRLWNNIEKYGEKPLYIKVHAEWNWLHFSYDVYVEVHIQHRLSSPGIASIIMAITAFLLALSVFIYVSYFIFIEKRPPPFPFPRELMFILLLILLLILVRERRRRR